MAFSLRGSAAGGASAATELEEALKKARGGFAATVGFSFFINLLLFVSPLYMLQVYDRVLTSRSTPTLVVITLAAVGALAVLALLEAVRSRILVRTGVRMDQELNGRIFTSIFRQTIHRPNGGFGQALRDLDTVREFLTGSGFLAFCDAPWVPLFLAIAFLMHPWIGVVSLVGAIIIFALAILNNIATGKALKEANGAAVQASTYVSGCLRNAEVLEAMGMMGNVERRWAERHSRTLALQAKASDRAGSILAASKAMRMVQQVAILGVGGYLAIQNEISPGMMIAASIIMGRALAPLEMAVGNWKGFIAARTSYERLQELLRNNPPDKERMPLPRPEGRISFHQVVVVPPGAKAAVLKGVSFELGKGEVLGIIGASAAGKSTLARAAVGVWPPLQGVVRLDGNDLHKWRQEELGPHLGYLPQDVELFDGTIAENISRFGELEPEKVIAAAEKAGVHQMIQALPEGYDTRIGLGGAALSGGQRQRVALARALYDEPALIVMDEPNASLDQEGETALMAAVTAAKRAGQTVIIITHKPSVLAVVDKVLVLNKGGVEMFGPRNEVLAKFTRPVAVPQAAGAPS